MTKQALILDGRIGEDPVAAECSRFAVDWFNRQGWEVRTLELQTLDIAPCVGCFGCWIKTPGECVIDDAGRDVAREIMACDVLLYLTPIQFGGYSYQLKKALDRSIPNISPMFRRVNHEVHHRARYRAYPSISAIGWSAQLADGEDDLFETLVRRNAINMHAPRSCASVIDSIAPEALQRRVEWAIREVSD